MGANGESPKVIAPPENGVGLHEPHWSPDGRRVAYRRVTSTPQQVTIESRAATGGPPAVMLSLKASGDFCWLRDGKILYVLPEPPPNRDQKSVWQLNVDTGTGKAVGQPRRYIDWVGASFSGLSASDDATRVAFKQQQFQSDVWVGQLQSNSKWSREPWKMTPNERNDWVGGWTPDNKSILLFSNRNGNYDIFRQSIDALRSEPVLTGTEDERAPQVSPDGKWILFWSWPRSPDGGHTGPGRLMRVPMIGGPSEAVLQIKEYPGPIENYGNGVSRRNPSLRCPTQPGASCVLSEVAEGRLAFSAFDPTEGKKQLITEVEVPRPKNTAWDLSQDGSRIVVQLSDDVGPCRHRIIKTSGAAERDVAIEKTSACLLVAWAAGGQGLFVTRHELTAHSLMHVTLDGKATELRSTPNWFDLPKPSSDGRYLAFSDSSTYGNVWLIEDVSQ